MTTPLPSTDLRLFLKDELAIDDPLADEDALFSSGVLDSVSMMQLIAFIEEKTGIDVRPSDVTLENFDTLARIVSYAAGLV